MTKHVIQVLNDAIERARELALLFLLLRMQGDSQPATKIELLDTKRSLKSLSCIVQKLMQSAFSPRTSRMQGYITCIITSDSFMLIGRDPDGKMTMFWGAAPFPDLKSRTSYR